MGRAQELITAGLGNQHTHPTCLEPDLETFQGYYTLLGRGPSACSSQFVGKAGFLSPGLQTPFASLCLGGAAGSALKPGGASQKE